MRRRAIEPALRGGHESAARGADGARPRARRAPRGRATAATRARGVRVHAGREPARRRVQSAQQRVADASACRAPTSRIVLGVLAVRAREDPDGEHDRRQLGRDERASCAPPQRAAPRSLHGPPRLEHHGDHERRAGVAHERRARRRARRARACACMSAPRRSRESCQVKSASSARKSGSLSTLPCTITNAGVAATMPSATSAAITPPAASAASTTANAVTAAAAASTKRAAFTGDAPAATPAAIAAGNPGGKCTSGAVVSAARPARRRHAQSASVRERVAGAEVGERVGIEAGAGRLGHLDHAPERRDGDEDGGQEDSRCVAEAAHAHEDGACADRPHYERYAAQPAPRVGAEIDPRCAPG